MKTTIHPANERGGGNFGWLNANYSFSFARYYDAEKTNFGMLRVLNDDFIEGGQGFPTHPHKDMEIISIPLQGALAHEDSTGGKGVIRPNEVQVMSAGKGVTHSESNHIKNAVTNLLQIWIMPNKKGVEPRYQQQYFDEHQRVNQWQPIVSNKHPGAMQIHQDAVLSRLILEKGETIDYTMHYDKNGVYVFVIDGELSIGDKKLNKRDAIGVEDVENFDIFAEQTSELIAIEVPMSA